MAKNVEDSRRATSEGAAVVTARQRRSRRDEKVVLGFRFSPLKSEIGGAWFLLSGNLGFMFENYLHRGSKAWKNILSNMHIIISLNYLINYALTRIEHLFTLLLLRDFL